jgi:hypothetical protein
MLGVAGAQHSQVKDDKQPPATVQTKNVIHKLFTIDYEASTPSH